MMTKNNTIGATSNLAVFVLILMTTSCHAFSFGFLPQSLLMRRLSSTSLHAVEISSATDLPNAAKFMVDAFWLNSPQNLVLESGDSESLISEQADDLQDKYGERMGKRVLVSTLMQARSDDELVGLVGLEISLLDKDLGDTISSTKSEELLKQAVASLGPKQRRQYRDASVKDIATELLPPHLEPVAVLSNLVVSPKARRQGIAQQLCAEAERLVRSEWGYDELYLRVEAENEAARGLYEGKLGFTQRFSVPEAMGVRVSGGSFSQVDIEILVLAKKL